MDLEQKVRSWLPLSVNEAEIKVFDHSLKAVEDIKLFQKPCIAYIHFSALGTNGSNFIELVKKTSTYVLFFVVCEDKGSHRAALSHFGLKANKIICVSPFCSDFSCNLEANDKHARFITNQACENINIIFQMHETLVDIKNDINLIQEKANTWEMKFLPARAKIHD